MSIWTLLPIGILAAPLIPPLLEMLRRKDVGPREIPEQTTYEKKPDIEGSDMQETAQDQTRDSMQGGEKFSFINVFRRKTEKTKDEHKETACEEKTGEVAASLETSQGASQTPIEEKPSTKSIPMLERARGKARVKVAHNIMRAIGDISIPDGTKIDNNLAVQGNLRMGKQCQVHGSLKVFGNVEIGEYSTIDGHVLSEGKIIVGRNCKINGIVDSVQDILLKENAVVEAVSTEKTVRLEAGARINRRILSGTYIAAFPTSAPLTEVPQEPAPSAEAQRQPQVPGMPPPQTELQKPAEPVQEVKPVSEELTEIESRVLQLARMGDDVEEIGLRLLIDPSEVQRALSVLTAKGCLDKEPKPSEDTALEKLRLSILGITQPRETRGATPTAARPKEERIVLSGGPSEEQIKELFERMLASKMRDGLKKKLEKENRERKSHG